MNFEERIEKLRRTLETEVEGSPEWCLARGYLNAVDDAERRDRRVDRATVALRVEARVFANSGGTFTRAEAEEAARERAMTALSIPTPSGVGLVVRALSVRVEGER